MVNIHKFLYFKQEQNVNLFSILLFIPYPIGIILLLCAKNIYQIIFNLNVTIALQYFRA